MKTEHLAQSFKLGGAKPSYDPPNSEWHEDSDQLLHLQFNHRPHQSNRRPHQSNRRHPPPNLPEQLLRLTIPAKSSTSVVFPAPQPTMKGRPADSLKLGVALAQVATLSLDHQLLRRAQPVLLQQRQ
ncbi:hypothetical protein NLJ89_g11615 [Agrocybe chaxingu]|uniref:Uncharacterized protein n=1 Tax=Agrocybe chaxingu TaxID=84603 RepID=A0A9W8JP15_9AGAR|nr:hypothetical protein NLJ89_g11615 [Agrocybe chaxingu]